MGGVRECQTGGVLTGWRERMRARAVSDYHLPVGLRTCDAWAVWDARDDEDVAVRLTDEALELAPDPAWADAPCSGSSDLAALFGGTKTRNAPPRRVRRQLSKMFGGLDAGGGHSPPVPDPE